MALGTVNPTRMELTRVKRQLATAKRGHKLLKDKQDEFVQRFMEIIKENRALRLEVEEELAKIMKKYISAKQKMSFEGIVEALMVPSNSVSLSTSSRTVMNIKIPTIQYEAKDKIDLTYGFAFTHPDLDDAIMSLSKLLPKMIKMAELEKACDMLAKEIEKTRRRVNAIEFIMIPEMEETIRYITMKLEDNERSNIIRLMKSKEIILAKNSQN
ncbi:MAG TPA: V-type ATP synthase subunit D [Bacilli bacterium]|jgi:V/A-type H+-transporting ATPase subunit D|nr:V-type ATP synthase subunit D [Acholeplasmataceae bacterium]OQB63636.1 MAG: V-type sodium ATPase subunit D [Tenericutes bacterium ADurb.Bin140]HOE77479.1 V-type ATP synthase subunit D [Bacilli bacterium]HON64241.1 V-type ATP synthase subunit D [Bacilli bacterium]HOR96025.1 V-type ATP synthase subunit D [Bacilli bacterium]